MDMNIGGGYVFGDEFVDFVVEVVQYQIVVVKLVYFYIQVVKDGCEFVGDVIVVDYGYVFW